MGAGGGGGGVGPGGGGGGSGGGGGTCAAAASILNIRAHSLQDTVLPGRRPPGSGLMCPQCMQAIVSSMPPPPPASSGRGGGGAPAPAHIAGLGRAGLP